jgi:hypothetical protein
MAFHTRVFLLMWCLIAPSHGNQQFHQIKLDQCGETTGDARTKDALVYFGLHEGTCAKYGYDRPAGRKFVDVPSIGNVTLVLYDKKQEPSTRKPEGSPEQDEHAWKISLDRCSEAVIDKMMKDILAEEGFSEGTCARQGYSVPGGRERISVPYIGESNVDVEIDLYSKPPSRKLLLV